MSGWLRELAEVRVTARALVAGMALAAVFVSACALAFVIGGML